jgi:acetyl esterase/lipase
MQPLKIEPKESKAPYYAKLRVEADEAFLKTGKGKLYLGFHMDPLYRVHWNNLADPLRYELKAPSGVTVSSATGEGPKVEQPADSDPREFLVDVDMGQAKKPIELAVKYFACNDEEGWCKAVEQHYAILPELDGDGGWVFKRFLPGRQQGSPPAQPAAPRPRQQPMGGQAPARIPDGVEFTPDIAYREGNEKWKLDLAMPRERGDAPRPALVIVHGGGWRGGDKGGGVWRTLPLQYAAKGYVCISLNYRLTDEAPFPACVEDVKCAVRWLRANAKKYHVDPNRIGAYGNSAGAHLVAMLALVGPDAKLEGDGPYQDQSSLVQAVCCSATPADFANWGGDRDNTFLKRGLLRGPDDTFAERVKRASPITYARADAPPFLVVHGTADRTVPISHGDRLVEVLKKAGAKDVTYMRYDGAGHGVFNQHSDETHPAMEKFFARTIGAAPKQP